MKNFRYPAVDLTELATPKQPPSVAAEARKESKVQRAEAELCKKYLDSDKFPDDESWLKFMDKRVGYIRSTFKTNLPHREIEGMDPGLAPGNWVYFMRVRRNRFQGYEPAVVHTPPFTANGRLRVRAYNAEKDRMYGLSVQLDKVILDMEGVT